MTQQSGVFNVLSLIYSNLNNLCFIFCKSLLGIFLNFLHNNDKDILNGERSVNIYWEYRYQISYKFCPVILTWSALLLNSDKKKIRSIRINKIKIVL